MRSAIAGQTVDQDSPGVAVTKGFTLMAPPGKPELVSPITTSVMAKESLATWILATIKWVLLVPINRRSAYQLTDG
jgi:hypothetical protein